MNSTNISVPFFGVGGCLKCHGNAKKSQSSLNRVCVLHANYFCIWNVTWTWCHVTVFMETHIPDSLMEDWTVESCSSSSSSMQSYGQWDRDGQPGSGWDGYRCRFREPSREDDDWLPEDDELLLEMVEWGLLKGVVWSNEDTAMDARILDSAEMEDGQKSALS